MIHSDPDLLLLETAHRPFPPPARRWFFYQEWKQVLFINWAIDPQLLVTKIPKGTTLDVFNGKAYISLVVFIVRRTHPRGLPPIAAFSDFLELNLRTYVTDGNQQGIHFLDIQTDRRAPVLINKNLAGLPYEKAPLGRMHNGYYLNNVKKSYTLDIEYSIKNTVIHKSLYESWLTERYCNYQQVWGRTLRYPVHHQNWPLKTAGVIHAKINFPVAGTLLTENNIESLYYSPGVNVLGWLPEKLR